MSDFFGGFIVGSGAAIMGVAILVHIKPQWIIARTIKIVKSMQKDARVANHIHSNQLKSIKEIIKRV